MNQETVEKINNLDVFEKLQIYMDYYCTEIAMKHNFLILDKLKPNWKNGYGEPTTQNTGIACYNLWSQNNIRSFENFISDDNIIKKDWGEDWEKKKVAQRYSKSYHGIYHWYDTITKF